MKILAAWDDTEEADLLQIYMSGGGDNEVCLTTDEEALFAAATNGETWDVILQSLTFPSSFERGSEIYDKLQQHLPGVPIVLACRPTEIIKLPHFLLRGLRFYLYRDAQRDFMFLVQAVLESAVTVAQAEQAQRVNSSCARRSRASARCKRRSSRTAWSRPPATRSRPATSRPRSPSWAASRSSSPAATTTTCSAPTATPSRSWSATLPAMG